MAGVAPSEPVLARHVLVPVLEYQYRRLVDLEREVRRVGCQGVVHVSLVTDGRWFRQWRKKENTKRRDNACLYLFTRADASVHLVYEPPADHLEQDDPRARVQDLFARRPVRFVLHVRERAWTLPVHAHAHAVRHVDRGDPRRIVL